MVCLQAQVLSLAHPSGMSILEVASNIQQYPALYVPMCLRRLVRAKIKCTGVFAQPRSHTQVKPRSLIPFHLMPSIRGNAPCVVWLVFKVDPEDGRAKVRTRGELVPHFMPWSMMCLPFVWWDLTRCPRISHSLRGTLALQNPMSCAEKRRSLCSTTTTQFLSSHGWEESWPRGCMKLFWWDKCSF